MYAIGLMSGTSLDGVDVALVDIKNINHPQVTLIDFLTIPYSDRIKAEIESLCSHGSTEAICRLNYDLAYCYSDAVNQICSKANINREHIEFVASHGQTIYHLPSDQKPHQRSTLQIGEPAVIAYNTGIQVISNFRAMDLAAGGQGAPLVPYADYSLFRSLSGRILLNIGGIANITILPADGQMDEVIAFDTGPGNMIIDALMMHYYNKAYDENGQTAAKGSIDNKLLKRLLSNDYFKRDIPKSTGRELFGKSFVDKLLEEKLEVNDLIATVTAFTAYSIVDQIKRFKVCPINDMIISGGGVHNQFIVNILKELLDFEIKPIESFGITADSKEAVAFAVLGFRTLHNRPSNLPSATGANEHVILGSITPAPYK